MTDETLITLTPRAVGRAKAPLSRAGKSDHGVRVGVRVYLDVKSRLFLAGTPVDHEDGLMESGFRFRNPNAKRACSCGDSLTV